MSITRRLVYVVAAAALYAVALLALIPEAEDRKAAYLLSVTLGGVLGAAMLLVAAVARRKVG